MADIERESGRLTGFDAIVFFDNQQGRRAVFGAREIFELTSQGSDISVVTRNEIKELPVETINNIPEDAWGEASFTIGEQNQRVFRVVFVKWRYLPAEFDVTNPHHPAQR